jgi:rhodanese-related sulfurtransferase
MNIEIVTAETVRDWIDAGDAVVVDVREEHEYAAGHIAGSTLIPLSRFDPALLPPNEGKRLVLHCASGIRCGHAANYLQANEIGGRGPDVIYRMAGGIMGWKQIGGVIQT